MSPAAIERHDDARLDEQLREWSAAGLISDAQVSAVERYESERRSGGRPLAGPPRLGALSEAAAYVGTVLALIGGAVGLGPEWGSIHLALRLLIAGALAVVGFATGTWLVGIGDPGSSRLGSFLWVLGTGGVALAAGTLVFEIAGDSPWMAVAIGSSVGATGLALWRNRDRPLQALTAGFGVAMGAGGMLAVLDVPVWVGGVLLWLAAATVAVATARIAVRPVLVVRCMAGAAAIVGAFVLGELSVRLGASVALATAAVIVFVAVRLGRHTPLLVVGVVGAIAAVQTLVQTTFRGPVGGAVVALVGLATVLVIVLRARTRSGAAM